MRREGFAAVVLAAMAWMAGPAAPADGVAASPQVVPASETYKAVYDGWKWFHVYCYRCHGTNAVATTLAPDLLDANRKMERPRFVKIVQTGVPDKGMQGWDKLLDDKQIEDLYAYVRARADKVLPPGRVDEAGPAGGPWIPPPGWTPR